MKNPFKNRAHATLPIASGSPPALPSGSFGNAPRIAYPPTGTQLERVEKSSDAIALPFGFRLSRRPQVVERLQVRADGMVERFVPSVLNKEAGPVGRIIRAFSNKWQKVSGEPPARFTTEQGSAQFAEPMMAQSQIVQLRYDHRAIIADTRQMIYDCPRARKSTRMYALEAVRRGVKIVPFMAATRGSTASIYKVAQECAERIEAICNLHLFSWAWMQIVEGDLFLQIISDGNCVTDITRMPADGIERNSDTQDKFPDPFHAFSQVGVASNMEYATWPEALMVHGRWEHVDGERYGNPCLVAGRRLRKLLELSEDHQVLRRMSHSHQQILWIIGSKDKPGLAGTDDEIKHFVEQNGFEKGLRDPLNPMNAVLDRFGNGNVDAKILEGDPNISDIEDLRYLSEIYGMALPTPFSLMNFNAKDINRDILTEQYRQWLNDTQLLSDHMVQCIRHAYEVDLLLNGILPASIQYTISIAPSDAETKGEKTERLLKMYQNTLGTGQNAIPAPMISSMEFRQLLQEDLQRDPVEALALIDTESEEKMNKFLAYEGKLTKVTNPPEAANGSSSGNASKNGHASNGKTPAGARN